MLPVTKVILDILRKWLKENLIPITDIVSDCFWASLQLDSGHCCKHLLAEMSIVEAEVEAVPVDGVTMTTSDVTLSRALA